MNKQFVPYELAIELRNLGFDDYVFAFYWTDTKQLILDTPGYLGKHNGVHLQAPLWQQAFDWLFKKLEFKYPYLKLEIYSDNSGSQIHEDGDNFKSLDISFNNLEEALELILNKTRDE